MHLYSWRKVRGFMCNSIMSGILVNHLVVNRQTTAEHTSFQSLHSVDCCLDYSTVRVLRFPADFSTSRTSFVVLPYVTVAVYLSGSMTYYFEGFCGACGSNMVNPTCQAMRNATFEVVMVVWCSRWISDSAMLIKFWWKIYLGIIDRLGNCW